VTSCSNRDVFRRRFGPPSVNNVQYNCDEYQANGRCGTDLEICVCASSSQTLFLMLLKLIALTGVVRVYFAFAVFTVSLSQICLRTGNGSWYEYKWRADILPDVILFAFDKCVIFHMKAHVILKAPWSSIERMNTKMIKIFLLLYVLRNLPRP
jgi:hypothetical protein